MASTTKRRFCTCLSSPTWAGSSRPARSCGPRSPLVTVALGQARLSTRAGSRSPISAASESVLRSQATSSGVPSGSGGPPTRTARESPITAPS